jgi:class 3 adenylate cyclase
VLRRLTPALTSSGVLHPATLRFRDPETEAAFMRDFSRRYLLLARFAGVLAVALWVAFGVLAAQVVEEDLELEFALRFGVGLPLGLLLIGATYYRQGIWSWWWAASLVSVGSSTLIMADRVFVEGIPRDWAYVGVTLVLMFAFVFAAIPFALAIANAIYGLLIFNIPTILFTDDTPFEMLYANFWLSSFVLIGAVAAYRVELTRREGFLQERELAYERNRANGLLLNVLPQVIAERLKDRAVTIAESFDDVSVVFADLVGFTPEAARTEPQSLVGTLDAIFSHFDSLADSLGVEKIKTVGDAYMVASGLPEPRQDHLVAAAEMALGMLAGVEGQRWPSGEPIRLRVGIACGSVIAGVIGKRKFAYDLWGDTVNTASRMESHGSPGEIQVPEVVRARLEHLYAFDERHTVDVKGKGPTTAYFMRGRLADPEAGSPGGIPAP